MLTEGRKSRRGPLTILAKTSLHLACNLVIQTSFFPPVLLAVVGNDYILLNCREKRLSAASVGVGTYKPVENFCKNLLPSKDTPGSKISID